jgi:AcrR family transcriptional regulator
MKHQPIVSFPENAAGLSRRALAKQQTRQRLLAAARRLFISRGYEAATIRDIASEAGLSTGAVFASFSDKAELFNEVIIADCERMSQDMAPAKAEATVVETLLALLRPGYVLHMSQLPLTQAALGFSWARGHELEMRYRKAVRQVLQRLSEAIRRGVERGDLSTDTDVALTSEMVLDSYLSNLRRAIFDGWDLDALQARLERQIGILLAGYRAAA